MQKAQEKPAAPRVPTITDKELARQEAIFNAARRVKQLQKDIKAREDRETRYLSMLRSQLDEAKAEFHKLTNEAVADWVRS